MRRFLHKFFKTLSTAIFVILVLLMAVMLIYIVRVNFLAGNDKLGEVRINMYTILSQSMYPTIEAGDVVVTYKEDNDKYNEGDVITFISPKNGNINITHRVQKVYELNNKYSYETKGDNNSVKDNELTEGNNILGRVIFRIPKIGYIQSFLVTKTGWIVAVVIPAGAIIIYDILKVILIALGIKKKPIQKYSDKKDQERIDKARKRLKEVVDSEEESEGKTTTKNNK